MSYQTLAQRVPEIVSWMRKVEASARQCAAAWAAAAEVDRG